LARYRLRFLLQEIDLREGDTLIGRSALCHVTIEDPLVSRQHSRIRIQGESAVLEDLGSRNGTYVNGRTIDGAHALTDGDRIRVGTLELVFCTAADRLRESRPGKRTTGFMCHCADCGIPYPAELHACVSCGSTRRVDDDTISGVVGNAHRNWTLELLTEVLDKAVGLQRWEDVERMLGRARVNVDGRLAAGQGVDAAQLERVTEAAIRLALGRGGSEWAAWVLSAHAALGISPSPTQLDLLEQVSPVIRGELHPALERLADALSGAAREPADHALAARLRGLAQTALGR
jgi:hypothetical protein